MSAAPKVSVVIPVYNTEKYLRQCLDSVTDQSLENIEIICVDDGSTDNSPEILREYAQKDNRIHILNQQNLYAGVARNNGLNHAVGEYVFFMDSDDYCNHRLLEKTVRLAEETWADMVVFDHVRFDEETGRTEIAHDIRTSYLPAGETVFNYRTNPRRIMSIVNPPPWNKLLRRDFLLKWELTFDSVSSSNDVTFSALCAACASRIAYLNEVLITHRIKVANSITSSKPGKQNDIIQVACQIYDGAKRLPHYAEIEISAQFCIARHLKYYLYRFGGNSGSPQYMNFLGEIGKLFFGLPLFYQLDDMKKTDRGLYQFVQDAKKEAEEVFDTKYFPKIIVSLTSYPKLIGTVHQVIETILAQTMQPDSIVLWLAESQFPNRDQDLPKQLRNLESPQFQIRWTEDLKSYKKLIPALEAFPDNIIITIDDDILLEPEMIERLVKGYRKHPDCIQCHRCTTIDLSIDDFITIRNAEKVYPVPSYLHKVTGGAGCLYPPHSLHPDVLKKDLFLRLAPTSDDIWFWLMGALNGYKVNVVEGNLPKLHYIPGSQEDALCRQNDQGEKLFFVHLKNVLRYYPVLQDVLSYEYSKFQQQCEADAIQASASYKIGRMITFIPRKIRGGIRCYQEHGMGYTLRRVKEKLAGLLGGRRK